MVVRTTSGLPSMTRVIVAISRSATSCTRPRSVASVAAPLALVEPKVARAAGFCALVDAPAALPPAPAVVVLADDSRPVSVLVTLSSAGCPHVVAQPAPRGMRDPWGDLLPCTSTFGRAVP